MGPPEPLRFDPDPLRALPHALGGPPLRGLLKARPADFVVEEIPAEAFSGEGEHLVLQLRKTGLNTADVARRLADWAGVARSAVGYAGLKDRQAVTTQYFSMCLPGREMPDPGALETQDLQLLSHTRHRRKLRRGDLLGNRFTLCLRELEGAPAQAEACLSRIRAAGVPNYFGAQRFGRGASNLIAAQALLAGRARRPPPERRRMLLSAARSHVFNQVLAARVRAGSWNRALPGEALLRDGGRRPLLMRHLSPELEERLRAGELHPSGPLPGRPGHCLAPEDEAARVERAAIGAAGLEDWVAALGAQRLDADRRALRLIPRDMHWAWEADALRLSFELPPGCYATVLVRELMRPASD